MTPVEWTPVALADVQAIKEYIARSSVQYAALMALRLVQSVERLQPFPDSGRIVPECCSSSFSVRSITSKPPHMCRIVRPHRDS